MSKIEILFRSPAFYTGLAIFVYHWLETVAPGLGGNVGIAVQGILAVLTYYFHTAGIQVAGQHGTTLGGASLRK